MSITKLFRPKKSKREKDILFDNGTIRVVLAGCLAIAISLLIMSVSSIFITRNAVVMNLKKVVIQYMAGSISSSIDARIQRAVDASLVLSSDPTVIKWIESYEKDEDAGTIVKEKMLQLVRDFKYDTSFLTSKLSKKYWSCDSEGVKLLYMVSEDDPEDSWFFKTLEMGKRYEININYDKELKDTFVWINVLSGEVNNPTAVTGVGMNLSKFINELIAADSEYGLNNEIWLVDDKGDIYLSKSQKYLNENLSAFLPDQLKTEILKSEESSNTFLPAEYKNKKGELYDVVYRKIKNTKWSLVIQISRAESLSFLNTITYNTIAACLLVILVVIIMFRILSKRIADPYKRTLLINQELEKKIGERTKELNDKNRNIMDSIDYAKVIQKTIFPSSEELDKAFDQYFIIWEPRDTVGGDFYWVRKFHDGTLIVLGDCTGHGVPGALMTMAVNAVLNRIVDEVCHNDPALILREMDRLLKQSLRREQLEEIIHDGLDAGVLFISNESEILFSGAQIPIWVGYEKGINEIKGNREFIGYDKARKEKQFTNTVIDYVQGMTLYMATDGLKDQPGGVKKLPYGKSRVMALLDSIKDMPMDKQKKEIIAAYEVYKEEELSRDDVAVIGIRIR